MAFSAHMMMNPEHMAIALDSNTNEATPPQVAANSVATDNIAAVQREREAYNQLYQHYATITSPIPGTIMSPTTIAPPSITPAGPFRMPQFLEDFATNSAIANTPANIPMEIAKIREHVTPKEVAKAIAKHTKQKTKQIQQQIAYMENEQKNREENMRNIQKGLASAKNKVVAYANQQKKLSGTKKKLIGEFQKEIEKLLAEKEISNITIDTLGRIIVTTTPISIFVEGWEAPKNAGCYQIRIDFSQNGLDSGIQALNITQRCDHYDSPTISRTRCCWGNVLEDIRLDFQTQNLYELVTDMIAYISSPHVQNGYIGLGGDKNKGWEQFFIAAKPLPENYSWEQFDQENRGQDTDSPLISISDFAHGAITEIGLDTPVVREIRSDSELTSPNELSGEATTSISPNTLSISPNALTFEALDNFRNSIIVQDRPVPERVDSMQYEELFYALRELGLTRDSSYHFRDLILRQIEGLIQELIIERIEVGLRLNIHSDIGSPISVLLNYVDMEPHRRGLDSVGDFYTYRLRPTVSPQTANENVPTPPTP